MALAVVPPLEPMLARLERELPTGEGLSYEPKWDGFRCLVFRSDRHVELRSRNQRPLARYFPELVEALRTVPPQSFVLDGEIVVTTPQGFDFTALMQRLHPATSRVERLARETPASFIAFDVLAIGGADLRRDRFEHRRRRLETLLGRAEPPVFVTPLTNDREVARVWLDRFSGGGIDGLVVKHRDLRYESGKRAMIKVKREQTADCVVAGFRWHNEEKVVGSLLLGLYGDDGKLHHVGLAASFTSARRRDLMADVAPFVTDLGRHPWENGFEVETSSVGRLPGAVSRWAIGHELTWVPLRPELVCEVGYDQLQGDRFRHPPKFRRWRPDRDPRSCTYAQFGSDRSQDLTDVLSLA